MLRVPLLITRNAHTLLHSVMVSLLIMIYIAANSVCIGSFFPKQSRIGKLRTIDCLCIICISTSVMCVYPPFMLCRTYIPFIYILESGRDWRSSKRFFLFKVLKGDLTKAATGDRDSSPARVLLLFDKVLMATARLPPLTRSHQ